MSINKTGQRVVITNPATATNSRRHLMYRRGFVLSSIKLDRMKHANYFVFLDNYDFSIPQRKRFIHLRGWMITDEDVFDRTSQDELFEVVLDFREKDTHKCDRTVYFYIEARDPSSATEKAQKQATKSTAFDVETDYLFFVRTRAYDRSKLVIPQLTTSVGICENCGDWSGGEPQEISADRTKVTLQCRVCGSKWIEPYAEKQNVDTVGTQDQGTGAERRD